MWVAWRARHSDGRAKFVNAGSFRLGDPLERYAESRRPATLLLAEDNDVMQAIDNGMIQAISAIESMSDSAYAFCQGDRAEIGRSRMPTAPTPEAGTAIHAAAITNDILWRFAPTASVS
jgi:hypothetical protein